MMKIDCTDVFFFFFILSPVHVVADRWLVMDGTSTLKSQLMLFSPGVKKILHFCSCSS